MKEQQTIQLPELLSFEQMWAVLQETGKKQEEMRKWQEETAKQQKEINQAAEKRAKELDRRIGKLGNRLGEIVEYMVMPNLMEKFPEFGFEFTKAYPHTIIKDKKNNISAEVDIILENGDKVMIVEVKSKPTTEDITDHVERMKKVRLHADLRGDNRKYLGTIAGMVMNETERNFALNCGFYVAEPSGETFNIIPPEREPKEW
jgi:hypothetical protein